MASLVEQRFVEEVLTSEGARLLKNQANAMRARIKFRTGNILSARKTSISNGKLVFEHAIYERFLDINVRKGGTRSRGIHNRFFYGHAITIRQQLGYGYTEEVIGRLQAALDPNIGK